MSSMEFAHKLSITVALILLLWLAIFYCNNPTKVKGKWKGTSKTRKLIGSERKYKWTPEKSTSSIIGPVLRDIVIKPSWEQEKPPLSPMIRDILGVAHFIIQRLPA